MENTVNLINCGVFNDGRYINKITMSVETVLRRVRTDKIIFPFESKYYEWNNSTRSNLIVSILKGNPIGQFYINFKKKDTYEMIDGQARVNALNGFINNKYRLNPKNPYISCVFKDELGNSIVKEYDISKKYFKDLPEALQDAILWYNLDILEFCGFADKETTGIVNNIVGG